MHTKHVENSCFSKDRSKAVVLMSLDYAMFFLLAGLRAFSCILWFVASFLY